MDGKSRQISSAIDSDNDDELAFTSRDWSKADDNLRNDGYRIGLESSQEEQLQTGFNAGFHEALQMAVAAGKLQGELCSVLTNSKGSVGTEVSTGNVGTLSSAPQSYDSLLSSCSNLILQIPTYLRPGHLSHLLSTQTENSRPGPTSSSLSVSDDSAVVASSKGDIVTPFCAASASETAKSNSDDTQSGVCETVCKNRSGFWTQLESFRDQAQALEFT